MTLISPSLHQFQGDPMGRRDSRDYLELIRVVVCDSDKEGSPKRFIRKRR